MFSSRDPVLAVRVPLATSVTKTTSVPGYQAFFTSLWFKTRQNEMKRRMCSRIYSRSLTNQQLSSLQAPPPPHQVRDTSCSMTSSALVVSEYSLSKDECQSFCTGQQSCQCPVMAMMKSAVLNMYRSADVQMFVGLSEPSHTWWLDLSLTNQF